MILLRNPEPNADGIHEQVVADSADGYEGWEVVEENVPRPKGHATRVGGKWVKDAEAERRAAIDRQAPHERYDALMKEIEALKARLAKAGL